MSTISMRNIILSGQTGPITTAPALSQFFTPEIRAGAALETVYKFAVEGLVGAPTSALLTVAFQAAMRTTGGGQGDINKVTDAGPIWQTLNSDSHASLLPDGDWPTRLANQTSTFPLVFFRRIRGGFSNRLAITPTLGGGTNPGIIMSVECEVRY